MRFRKPKPSVRLPANLTPAQYEKLTASLSPVLWEVIHQGVLPLLARLANVVLHDQPLRARHTIQDGWIDALVALLQCTRAQPKRYQSGAPTSDVDGFIVLVASWRVLLCTSECQGHRRLTPTQVARMLPDAVRLQVGTQSHRFYELMPLLYGQTNHLSINADIQHEIDKLLPTRYQAAASTGTTPVSTPEINTTSTQPNPSASLPVAAHPNTDCQAAALATLSEELSGEFPSPATSVTPGAPSGYVALPQPPAPARERDEASERSETGEDGPRVDPTADGDGNR